MREKTGEETVEARRSDEVRSRTENESNGCTMCWPKHHRKSNSLAVVLNIWFGPLGGGSQDNSEWLQDDECENVVVLEKNCCFFPSKDWIILPLKIFTWDSLKKGKIRLEVYAPQGNTTLFEEVTRHKS